MNSRVLTMYLFFCERCESFFGVDVDSLQDNNELTNCPICNASNYFAKEIKRYTVSVPESIFERE